MDVYVYIDVDASSGQLFLQDAAKNLHTEIRVFEWVWMFMASSFSLKLVCGYLRI